MLKVISRGLPLNLTPFPKVSILAFSMHIFQICEFVCIFHFKIYNAGTLYSAGILKALF